MSVIPGLLGGLTPPGTSAADLIADALKILGVLAAGETPAANEQTDAFNRLNDMLDSWANERLTLFATSRDAYTLTPGHNPHTIGGGGDFNATRPIRIDRASLVLAASSNAELPLNIVDDEGWQIAQGKSTTGTPYILWPETKYPLINLWLNPIPVNADTLVLYTWQQIGRLASVSATVSLPPGYARALRYNLAMELAPMYGAQPSDLAIQTAMDSKADIKRINTKPGYLRSDPALLQRRPFNVISGDRG